MGFRRVAVGFSDGPDYARLWRIIGGFCVLLAVTGAQAREWKPGPMRCDWNCARGNGWSDGPDPIGVSYCLHWDAAGNCDIYGEIIVDDPEPTGVAQRNAIIIDDWTPFITAPLSRNPCNDTGACWELINAVCLAHGHGGAGVGVDVTEADECAGPCANNNQYVRFRCVGEFNGGVRLSGPEVTAFAVQFDAAMEEVMK